MARFHADHNGNILQFLSKWQDERDQDKGTGIPKPAAAVYSVSFDEDTNAGLISAFNSVSGQFTMPGGTLTQTPPGGQGQPVTVNPPATFYAAFQNAGPLLTKLQGGLYSPTQQELAQIAAASFRAAGFAV